MALEDLTIAREAVEDGDVPFDEVVGFLDDREFALRNG